MPRTHGYSDKGKRCYGKRNWQAKGRVNAVGAIIDNQLLTVCLFDTNINSDIFYDWLSQNLKLPQKSVVVMDNATFHGRSDIKYALVKAKHTLVYLPPYSPDLNPIEHKWAQAKAIRKKYECSTYRVFPYFNFLC